jgi:hypothetical protein
MQDVCCLGHGLTMIAGEGMRADREPVVCGNTDDV